jgi:hypothetical protein
MTRLRRWWALPPPERGQFLTLWLLMPLMSASLRLVGYRRTLRWIERVSPPSALRGATTLAEADRLAGLAAIAGRHAAVEATCLRQALAVMLVLRRRGVVPSLKFGVDLKGATPDMHAWLELDGQALGQPDLRHRPFQR